MRTLHVLEVSLENRSEQQIIRGNSGRAVYLVVYRENIKTRRVRYMKAGPKADEFGAFLMSKLRDAAIDNADGLLSGHWRAPGLRDLQADLGKLTAEQRAVVRRCVINSVDAGIHDFLFALSEEHDAGGRIKVTIDGEDVARQSDGLHGEPFTEEGWFGRFSKHGVPSDPA